MAHGQGRVTSTLILMAEDGVFKACLSDRETEQVLWASSPTWSGLWEALEASLSSGTGVWREKRPYAPRSGK
jgi:hypothetical protein